MKKIAVLGLCVFTLALSWGSIYGQGFTGPGLAAATSQVQTVTVLQAKGLPKNSLVILTGSIVQSVKSEKYIFRDSTGDIAVDIDKDLWALLGISVGPNDTVEIGGKIEVEKRVAEIKVKYLKKP